MALFVFAAFVVLSIAAVMEAARHVRLEGRMRRGLPVWKEALSEGTVVFLAGLSEDVFDGHGRFIRKQNNNVLVQGIHIAERALVPYIGYIDLSAQEPRIQYLVPISVLPIVALLLIGVPSKANLALLGSTEKVIVEIVILLVLILPYFYQRWQILSFLSRKARVDCG
jgi:hypothetical protein